jgi:eukaryotic-like serine/threonine-protein kinase
VWTPARKLGAYRIDAQLRTGGMGTIFLAHRMGVAGFRRPVALKVVHPHLAREPRFVRMLIDEALLAARIHHPNVVSVEELSFDQGVYFLAMEYVHGASLAQLLRRLARSERRLVIDAAVCIAAEIALGLHAAHETCGDDGAVLGVVHRDVKPQNVLVSRAGHVKLIDFGIAKARTSVMRSATGSIKGTLHYLSPEQARSEPLDRRADLYSLGIVLWEMLTGRRLFDSESDLALLDQVRHPRIPRVREHRPEVPPALEAAVHRMLSLEADDRPETALEARDELLAAFPPAATVTSHALGALVGALFDEHLTSPALRIADAPTKVTDGLAPERQTEEKSRVIERLSVVAEGVDPSLGEPDPDLPTTLASPPRPGFLWAAVALLVATGIAGLAFGLLWQDTAPPVAETPPAPIAEPEPVEAALAVTPIELPAVEIEPARAVEEAAPVERAPTRRAREPRRSERLLIEEPGF